MSVDEERCYRCGEDPATERGIIYVRVEIDGRWQNVAVCRSCWDSHHAR